MTRKTIDKGTQDKTVTMTTHEPNNNKKKTKTATMAQTYKNKIDDPPARLLLNIIVTNTPPN